MADDTKIRSRRWLKRSAKTAGFLVAGITAVVIVAVVLLLLPPVRSGIMRVALTRVGSVLPGHLNIGRGSWPSIDTIRLEGIRWTDGPDSLVSAERIEVSIELLSLFKKDIRVENAIVEDLFADVPAITRRFSKPGEARVKEEKKVPPFPRTGSLPGVPSVAAERIRLTALFIRLSTAMTLTGVTIDAGFDASHGAPPWVRIDTLEAVGPDTTWRIDELSLYVAPDRGLITGEGRGALSPYWPIRLSITPVERDRFRLNLTSAPRGDTREYGDTGARDETSAPGDIGVDLDLRLAREGARLDSVSFAGEIRTPAIRDISKDPHLAPRVEGLPDLDGLTVGIRGAVGSVEEFTADLSVDIGRNNWLDGGAFTLTYGERGLSVRNVALDFPDLSITGELSAGPDSLRAAVGVRAKGTAWARTLFPNLKVPEPLSAVVSVSAGRAAGGRLVRMDVTAEGKVGGLALDGLRVQSDLSLDESAPSRIMLAAETMGLHVGLAAEVLRKPDVAARLAPIVVRETPIPLSSLAFPSAGAGTVRFSPVRKDLFVDNVRVTGDFGDLSVDADLDSLSRGPFAAAYTLNSPPKLLARAFKLTDEEKRRFEENWATDAPFTLEAEGNFSSTAAPPRVETTVKFRLPGPRDVAVLLPDSAGVSDLGPLEGALSISTRTEVDNIVYDASLDLRPTVWIDSSAVHVLVGGDSVVIDTVGVAFEGLSLGAKGTIDQGVFDLTASVDMPDSKIVRLFKRDAPDLRLRAWAHYRGTTERPVLDATLAGSIEGTSYRLPDFTLTVDLDTTRVDAALDAPQGMETPDVRLDRIAARLSSTRGQGLFPVRLSLDAAGEMIALHQSLRADTADGISAEVDTLELTVGNQDLRATKPFRIRLLSRPDGVSVEDVDLTGSLGAVRLSADLRPDSSNITGAVTITLPEDPPPALTRPHLWPERIDLELQVKGNHDVAASLDVRGFTLVDERIPTFHAEAKSDAEWLEGAVSVADSSGEIMTARGRVPASISIYPPSLAVHDGPVSVEMRFDSLPAVTRLIGPTKRIPQDEIIRISGRVVAGGTMASPDAAASLSFAFEDWPKLSQYAATLEAGLGSRAAADSLMRRGGAGISEELTKAWGNENDVALFFDLQREGLSVLTARGRYPLRLSFHPPRAWIPEGGRIDVRVDSDKIPLADFDPLLPLNIGLGGMITMELSGNGPPKDFSLEGSVSTKDFEISVADQARAAAQADLSLSGSSRRPDVKGKIEVVNGLIRVPDVPKHLHAAEGEAILWGDSSSAAGPDTAVAAEAKAAPPERTQEPAVEPDIDVSIRIPSALRIRGKGLDVELGGDLRIRQEAGMPTITGDLRALRGTLVFLGRTLQLERGTVTFYGGDEVNPSLDIALTTEVDGNKIQILFGGTVKKPKVDLSSDPDMAETDIMSVLLFGRTFDDLDNDEANLVRRRSAEMIASLGAVKLQEELGGQLGVDVVTVTSSGQNDEGTSLSVGKYLNPRTLLSYAYPLDSASRPYVSLEYFLKGRFVIRSTYDDQGVGSLGVGWSKDY